MRYAQYLQQKKDTDYSDMGLQQLPLYMSDEEFQRFISEFSAFMLTWLRVRTGSIWPTVLAHAVINAVAGGVLGYAMTMGNPYLGAPLGIAGLVPWFIFAGWLVFTNQLRPAPQLVASK